MIPPRADLDDEGTRLLTYKQAYGSSVRHLEALASLSAGIRTTISGRSIPSDLGWAVDEQPVDDLTDELTYRAGMAALSGVVQRSLRDFLA